MPYIEDDEPEQAAPKQQREPSPLWPSATDARSGMRHAREPSSDAPKPATAPYQLLTPMGNTAYGGAFRARHLAQEREVALHFLELPDDREGSFARELPVSVAKIAQLSHPNVIALEAHGHAESDGTTYLVTEPLEGVSLAAQLEDSGSLPLPRALSIALQIGRALRAAHKLGIVHGALRAANVRVVQTEHGELARVVGFGCRAFVPRGREANAPPDPYEAPECALGAAPDARSDVFAIGALLFRMLTGKPPPAQAEQRARVLAEWSEPSSRELKELLLRCLEPQPAQRLAEVVMLMRELRQIARSVNANSASEAPPIALSESTLPPVEPSENDSSGSLFPADASALRESAVWIVAGLLLALAAVWLLWHASARVHPQVEPIRGAGEAR